MAAKGKKYGQWSADIMEKAITGVRNGELTIRGSCRAYSVPRTTLKRHLAGINKYAIEARKHFGHPVDLTPELEEQLVQHTLTLESMFFGMSAHDVRKLAYQLAEANEMHHSFNAEKKTAGKKWFYSFMRRHPELSLRQPEATSLAKATAFNMERVTAFFDLYERTINTSNGTMSPSRIFNMDETGLQTVQKPQKVLARKGKHQVGGIVSAERGETTTCVCCVSEAGQYVPPLLIFKRKRMVDNLKDGAPPGAMFACQESGWMNSEIFCKWLQHFIDTVHPSVDNKVLLLLDGHASHTKNLEAINMARASGVIMLSIPPHCSHRLQPLDVSFYGPLSTAYNQVMDSWMRTNPGRAVTQYQVSRLLGEAYGKVATVGHAASGFLNTGLWPPNRNIFPDYMFAPASVTDRPSSKVGPSVVAAASTDSIPSTYETPKTVIR